jgi:hypothetical protein
MRSTTDPGPLQRTGGSGRTSGHRPYRQIGQREASDAWSQWTWLDEVNVASFRHCTWLDEDVVVAAGCRLLRQRRQWEASCLFSLRRKGEPMRAM